MKITLAFLSLIFIGTLAFGEEQRPIASPEPSPAPTPLASPIVLPSPAPSPTASTTPMTTPMPMATVIPTPSPEPQWEKFNFHETKEHRLRFAVSPYYGLGTSLQADNISESTNGNQYWASGNFPTNMAPGIALEVYDSPENSFGWSAGGSYDFRRIVTGLNAEDNLGNQVGGPFNSPQTGITFLTIYANGLYRFHTTYFEFGANYTFPNLQGGINNIGNTSISGGVGVQVAAGVNLSDTFALEFWLQELSLNGNTNTSTSSLIYYNLYFFNPQLRLRISF